MDVKLELAKAEKDRAEGRAMWHKGGDMQEKGIDMQIAAQIRIDKLTAADRNRKDMVENV